MNVHIPSELCKPNKLYMLEPDQSGFVYFVDLDNIRQTILVRLDPVYVCQHVEDQVKFLLPSDSDALRCFKMIEDNVLQMFTNGYTNSSLPFNILQTNTKDTNISLQNSFVEPILALHGFVHENDKISFRYEMVQYRPYTLDIPTFNRDLNLFEDST